MGLFDTIHLHPDVTINCTCGARMYGSFQSKSLHAAMDEYVLQYDDAGQLRLYRLDEPDQKYWQPYTADERADLEQRGQEKSFGGAVANMWLLHGGRFAPEGLLVENRHARHMGAWPHQWFTMYTTCKACGDFTDVFLKFTDGVATLITTTKPTDL